MTEIVAVLLLITFCLFIWKMVKSIEINVTVKMPAIQVKAPDIAVTITPPPITMVEPMKDDIYDEKGDLRVKDQKPMDPMAMFNTVMHGMEEVMRDGDI